MRSDWMKKGLEKAPHRSLFKALGLTDDESAGRLWVSPTRPMKLSRDISISIRLSMP